MEYRDLVESFKTNPRDVQTVPKAGTPKWFYVFVERNLIYVEKAHSHSNTSNIRTSRMLNSNECEDIFSFYQKRKLEEPVSQKVQSITRNASYWFGIFSDLNL